MNKEIAISISTRHTIDRDYINQWFRKKSSLYIIAYELGANGHKHLQCAMTLEKEIRPNTLKASLIKYIQKKYQIEKVEEKNIRVFINTNPKEYHLAYCVKENDYILYDNEIEITKDERLEQLWEKYKHIKEEYKKKVQKEKVNKVDSIYNSFRDYCEENQITEPEQYIKLYISTLIRDLTIQEKMRYFTRSSLEKICELVRLELQLPFRDDQNIIFSHRQIENKKNENKKSYPILNKLHQNQSTCLIDEEPQEKDVQQKRKFHSDPNPLNIENEELKEKWDHPFV